MTENYHSSEIAETLAAEGLLVTDDDLAILDRVKACSFVFDAPDDLVNVGGEWSTTNTRTLLEYILNGAEQ